MSRPKNPALAAGYEQRRLIPIHRAARYLHVGHKFLGQRIRDGLVPRRTFTLPGETTLREGIEADQVRMMHDTMWPLCDRSTCGAPR